MFPGKPTRVSGKQENAGEVLDNGGPGRANQPELGLEVFQVWCSLNHPCVVVGFRQHAGLTDNQRSVIQNC